MDKSYFSYVIKLYNLRSDLCSCLDYLISHKNTLPVSDDFDSDKLTDMIYSLLDSFIYISDFLENV